MRNIEIRTLRELNYELTQELRNFIVLNQRVDTGDIQNIVNFGF